MRLRDLSDASEVRIWTGFFDLKEFAPHAVDFVYLGFGLAGSAVHRTDRRVIDVGRGSVYVVRPGHWLTYESIADYRCAVLCLDPALLHDELAWVLNHPELAASVLHGRELPARIPEDVVARIENWLELLEAEGDDFSVVQIGLTTCVLGELAAGGATEPSAAGVPISRLVREAMRLLETEIAAEWTVERLARATNVSASYLHRLFRRELGHTPKGWLIQLRGERAAALLVRTDLSVAAIAAAVGWSDPAYASRRFRALYGLSPLRYRERFRGGLEESSS